MNFHKEIKSREEQIIEEFYFQVRENEKQKDYEYKASTKISAAWKRYKHYSKYTQLKQAVNKIKKFYISYYQQKKLKIRKIQRVEEQNITYFCNQALVIQRYFRGYYNRKYIHDFYARKKYLNHIKYQNDEFLKELNRNQEEEQREEEKRKETVARGEFEQLALNLHHLQSTKVIPGVYNPPYQSIKPSAFDIPIETHLKATFKAHWQNEQIEMQKQRRTIHLEKLRQRELKEKENKDGSRKFKIKNVGIKNRV